MLTVGIQIGTQAKLILTNLKLTLVKVELTSRNFLIKPLLKAKPNYHTLIKKIQRMILVNLNLDGCNLKRKMVKLEPLSL